MRIQDFNPVIKEDNEMSDVVTAHGLVNRALNDTEARQEYFEFLQHLRNKHGKDYSTRIHQKAAELAKSSTVDEAVVDSSSNTMRGGVKNSSVPTVVNNSSSSLYMASAAYMKQQATKYQKHVAGTNSTPAGPDTSKFSATRSGMIAFEKDVTVHGNYYGSDRFYQNFVKIGGNVDYDIKKKMEAEFREWLATATGEANYSYVTPDRYYIVVGDANGTNWGGYGLSFKKIDDDEWNKKYASLFNQSVEGVNETIVKVGSQYELKSHTGKNLGKYPTKAGAKKREQQVNYFKHVNEAGGNYEELKNRRLRNEDPFVVYDHTLNGVILTSDSLEEATKEAVEWAAYDDITVSVIKKANKRKVLTIDGYSGAMDYYEEHGFPEELDEDAWTGDNPAWHNGNNQWNDGTDQWHSADDGAGGGAAPLTGAVPVDEDFNAQDVVSVDVPLLIRLLEYAREDAKTDMDLHDVTERLIALSQEGNTLTMQDYDTICNTKETD